MGCALIKGPGVGLGNGDVAGTARSKTRVAADTGILLIIILLIHLYTRSYLTPGLLVDIPLPSKLVSNFIIHSDKLVNNEVLPYTYTRHKAALFTNP